MYDTNLELKDLDKLPTPKGYKLLLAVARMQEKKGAVYLPGQYTDLENTASILGYVVSLGPDAYGDTNKFPSGQWCKEGDWVIFKSYSGTRVKIGEQEFRFINDDQIEGTISDPTMIERPL